MLYDRTMTLIATLKQGIEPSKTLSMMVACVLPPHKLTFLYYQFYCFYILHGISMHLEVQVVIEYYCDILVGFTISQSPPK